MSSICQQTPGQISTQRNNKIEGPLGSPFERKVVLCASKGTMELVIQPKDKAQFQSTKEASADPPFMLFPYSFRCMDQAHALQGKTNTWENEEMWPGPGG